MYMPNGAIIIITTAHPTLQLLLLLPSTHAYITSALSLQWQKQASSSFFLPLIASLALSRSVLCEVSNACMLSNTM
ncbi:hypothetical protein BKA81DRAFT_366921 [Phyllosticta paracitricarpa]